MSEQQEQRTVRDELRKATEGMREVLERVRPVFAEIEARYSPERYGWKRLP